MIEIIKWPFPGQIRYYLSYNRITSKEISFINISGCQHLQGTEPIECDQPENSTAQLPRCERLWHFPSHWSCRVVTKQIGIVLISGPGRAQCHNRIEFIIIIICNGAVWSCISIISARAVTCTSSLRLLRPVHNCHLTSSVGVRLSRPDSDSESARLTPPKGGQ